MTDVEKALVPKVNGLLVQHMGRDHSQSNHIPCGPEFVPIFQRRNIARKLLLFSLI